jgi:uncharacterized small protein (DUF1192 family)
MRGVSQRTKDIIALAGKILAEDHPQTLRQLHYRIFSLGVIDYKNDRASYRKLCRTLTDARRAHRRGELLRKECTPTETDRAMAKLAHSSPQDTCDARRLQQVSPKLQRDVWNGKKTLEEAMTQVSDEGNVGIPSNWIVDELRQGERVNVWENAQEYIECVRESYRRDNWQDQPGYCELWGEKATVLGALRPIAEEWGVMLRVCRGFGSAGMEDQVGRLFEGIDKPITVFYVGDHDASGVLIEKDMHRRVQTASGVEFEMIRLAIHVEDIAKFNLPPQQIKENDVRAPAFRQEFGQDAATVELEALPVAELKRRIVAAVEGLIDFEKWNRATKVQEVELNCIAEFANRMKNLPQLGG